MSNIKKMMKRLNENTETAEQFLKHVTNDRCNEPSTDSGEVISALNSIATMPTIDEETHLKACLLIRVELSLSIVTLDRIIEKHHQMDVSEDPRFNFTAKTPNAGNPFSGTRRREREQPRYRSVSLPRTTRSEHHVDRETQASKPLREHNPPRHDSLARTTDTCSSAPNRGGCDKMDNPIIKTPSIENDNKSDVVNHRAHEIRGQQFGYYLNRVSAKQLNQETILKTINTGGLKQLVVTHEANWSRTDTTLGQLVELWGRVSNLRVRGCSILGFEAYTRRGGNRPVYLFLYLNAGGILTVSRLGYDVDADVFGEIKGTVI